METLQNILKHPGPIQWDPVRNTVKIGLPGESGEVDELLKDLQGNILTWHKRGHAHYFFINFKNDSAADKRNTRYLLSRLASGGYGPAAASPASGPDGLPADLVNQFKGFQITSEWDLRSKVENEADMGKDQTIFISLLLTGRGYKALGFENRIEGDDAFLRGMAGSASALNDPDRNGWMLGEPHLEGGKDDPKAIPNPDSCNPIKQVDMDALIILAYNPPDGKDTLNVTDVAEIVSGFRKTLHTYFTPVHEEFGRALKSRTPDERTRKPWYIEPFGFRDGISQPLFYETDRKEDANQFFPSGDSKKPVWHPKTPLKTVLVKDPNGGALSCGSYFVYRKLKQDVTAFYRDALKLVQPGMDLHDVLAGFMGRYPDGRFAKTDPANTASNDFDYRNAESGSKCPFHAHIRRVNPRNETGEHDPDSKDSDLIDPGVRIARRALCFGSDITRDLDNIPSFAKRDPKLPPDPTLLPEGDHGLHFMCAQSNIEAQFEVIQGKWANNARPPLSIKSGADAIAGQVAEGRANRILFPTGRAESPMVKPLEYKQMVSMQGGEYFFAPCLSSLKTLFDKHNG